MEGHDQTGGIDQCKEGVSCFPSRQCSIRLCSTPTTNLSHSSLTRKTKVQSFSLSLNTSSCHIRSCTHTTHTPPQQTSQLQRIQQRSSTIYKPTIFSINHRSAPWLVTTPIIDLGLDSLVDISCMQGYTSTKHLHLHLGGTYYTRVSEDLLIENDASPQTVNLTRTNKDRSRAGRV